MTVEELGRVGFWSKCKYRMLSSTTTMGERQPKKTEVLPYGSQGASGFINS